VTDRTERWRADLTATLADAATLVSRGRAAFDSDLALPLACEAICNRVGDLAKKLISVDPARYAEPIWTLAARNYPRPDVELLWNTMTADLPALAAALKSA
jgi:hypothetical protein